MDLRATVLHASVPFFVFGLLLSFFQLGGRRLRAGGVRLAFGSWADDVSVLSEARFQEKSVHERGAPARFL
jgi:hypothetical protein